jgi:hypothetical protein
LQIPAIKFKSAYKIQQHPKTALYKVVRFRK